MKPKGCFLLQMLIPIHKCKCKGPLSGPIFCAFVQKDFENKTAVLEKVTLSSLYRFVYFLVLLMADHY